MAMRQPLSELNGTSSVIDTGLTFERFGNPAIPHRTETDAGTLRIMSSWAFGGDAERTGGDLTTAIQLALELAGDAAGGFALDYRPLDNSTSRYTNVWDASTEIANANEALDHPETVAFIGGVHSGSLTQSIPLLSRATPPLAVVTPAATWPGLTRAVAGVTPDYEPGRYYPTGIRNVVRLCPTDDRIGQVAARWALAEGRRQRVAVFHDGGPYGECLALSFAAEFGAGGGTVMEPTALPADPVNFDRYVDSVAAGGADGVFIGAIASPAIGQFIGELRGRFDPDELTLIGGDGLASDDLFDVVPGGGAEGLVIAGPLIPSDLTDDGAIWAARMRERIGQDRDPDPFAMYAFEAAIAIVQAIDAAGDGDRPAVLAALRATGNFRGLSGTFSVDAAGDRRNAPVRLARVESGRFVTFTSDPA